MDLLWNNTLAETEEDNYATKEDLNQQHLIGDEVFAAFDATTTTTTTTAAAAASVVGEYIYLFQPIQSVCAQDTSAIGENTLYGFVELLNYALNFLRIWVKTF